MLKVSDHESIAKVRVSHLMQRDLVHQHSNLGSKLGIELFQPSPSSMQQRSAVQGSGYYHAPVHLL